MGLEGVHSSALALAVCVTLLAFMLESVKWA